MYEEFLAKVSILGKKQKTSLPTSESSSKEFTLPTRAWLCYSTFVNLIDLGAGGDDGRDSYPNLNMNLSVWDEFSFS